MADRALNIAAAYAVLNAASKLHHASGAWAFFMREIVKLPPQMGPVVLQSIYSNRWRSSPDPITTVREEAVQCFDNAWKRRDYR